MTKTLKTTILCIASVSLVAGLAGLGVALSKRAQSIQDQLENPVSVNYGGSSTSSGAASSSSAPGSSSAPVDSTPAETSETGTPVLALSSDTIELATTTSGVMPSSTISCNVTGVNNRKVVWSVADPSLVMISKTVSASDEAITVSLVKAFYGTTKLTAMSLVDSTVYKTCVVSWENPITSICLNNVCCYYTSSLKCQLFLTSSGGWSDDSYGGCSTIAMEESEAVLVNSPTEATTARNVATIRGVMYSDYVFSFKVYRPVQDSTNSHLGDIATNFYDAADSQASGTNTSVIFNDTHWGTNGKAWFITIRVHCSNATAAGRQMFRFLGSYYYCVNIGAK